MGTFVVRAPYITDVHKKIMCVLIVYYLKSSITYSKTYIVCTALPRTSRNVQIGEIWCFPEIPENPPKIPGKPRGKIRGFFVFSGCNRL
jgi:hypothetical protein